jgi:hypothetical protein
MLNLRSVLDQATTQWKMVLLSHLPQALVAEPSPMAVHLHTKPMNDALRLLEKLQRERFYGALEVKFENGQVTVLKVTQTILPHQSRKSGASQNVHSTSNP